MILCKRDMEYLEGKKFDDGYKLQLENNIVTTRLELLLSKCKDRNVLHVGCCDHLPLIKSKVENNMWLQRRLEEVSKRCIGIDIEEKTVEYVRKKGYSQDVYYGDITDDSIKSKIPLLNYDYVVLGEMLEHIDNPVDFLRKLKKSVLNLNKDLEIMVTVPNLLKMQRLCLRKSVEIINSDHRYWFSPYTLAKVLVQAGWYPSEMIFVDQEFSNWFVDRGMHKCCPKLRRLILKRKSYCGNGIVAIARAQV